MREGDATRGFAALGNPTRLGVFRLLVRAGQQGLPIGRIGAELGIPPSTLAHHLNQLTRARLILQQKSGREVLCTANYSALNSLIGFLTENCCEGISDTAPNPFVAAELNSGAADQ